MTTPPGAAPRIATASPASTSAIVYGTFTNFAKTPTIVANAKSEINVVSVVETTPWCSAVASIMRVVPRVEATVQQLFPVL